MNETSLCPLQPGVMEAHRFLWLRTFHPGIAVRVEQRDTAYVLVGRKLDGAGGYEPGELVVDRAVRISRAEWRRFLDLLDSARFWSPATATEDPTFGLDGSQWILEGVRNGRYRAVDRWSPEPNGPDAHFRRANLYLLELAELVPERADVIY